MVTFEFINNFAFYVQGLKRFINDICTRMAKNTFRCRLSQLLIFLRCQYRGKRFFIISHFLWFLHCLLSTLYTFYQNNVIFIFVKSILHNIIVVIWSQIEIKLFSFHLTQKVYRCKIFKCRNLPHISQCVPGPRA